MMLAHYTRFMSSYKDVATSEYDVTTAFNDFTTSKMTFQRQSRMFPHYKIILQLHIMCLPIYMINFITSHNDVTTS